MAGSERNWSGRLVSMLPLLLGIVVLLGAPLAAAAALGVWVPVPPDPALDSPAIDAFMAAEMDKHGLPGMALAVAQGEQIIYLRGYGTAGGGRPLTPQTPMYIGSQSKSVTALAIAQLVEQGKVDLMAPVRRYIPWFTVADPAAAQQMTVYHLLHHLSGLSEEGFSNVLPDQATTQDGVRALASARLTAPVGAKFQYFNMNYAVLALVVEEASGLPYADYIQQNIFNPLGMTRSTTDPAAAGALGLAQGYSRFFGFAVPAPQPHRQYEVGGGYIISTAEDMVRYAMALNNGGAYGGARVLSPEGLRRMFAPVQGYGMGWFVEPGHVYHGGANETFKTFVDLYPQRGLSLVLLINEGYMLDHYISAPQVFAGLEAIALGRQPPAMSQGWSVKLIGWGVAALVLALVVLHVFNLLGLRGWTARARSWGRARLVWDVAVSFIIPTVILLVVFSQIKGFLSYRFNLTYQLQLMLTTLTDFSVLMVVGTVPDYVQGFIKLAWVLAGHTRARGYIL